MKTAEEGGTLKLCWEKIREGSNAHKDHRRWDATSLTRWTQLRNWSHISLCPAVLLLPGAETEANTVAPQSHASNTTTTPTTRMDVCKENFTHRADWCLHHTRKCVVTRDQKLISLSTGISPINQSINHYWLIESESTDLKESLQNNYWLVWAQTEPPGVKPAYFLLVCRGETTGPAQVVCRHMGNWVLIYDVSKGFWMSLSRLFQHILHFDNYDVSGRTDWWIGLSMGHQYL